MSLIPADGGLRRAGANGWATIRYALDSNARTVRLCMILLTLGIAGIPALLILTYARPW